MFPHKTFPDFPTNQIRKIQCRTSNTQHSNFQRIEQMHSCFIRIEILLPKKVCLPRTHFIQCDLCELGNANDNSDDLNDMMAMVEGLRSQQFFWKDAMTNGKTRSWQKNRLLPNLGLRFQIWRLHSIWSWKGAAIFPLSLRGRLKIGISNCRLQLKKTFEEKNINFALVTVSKKNKTTCLTWAALLKAQFDIPKNTNPRPIS